MKAITKEKYNYNKYNLIINISYTLYYTQN